VETRVELRNPWKDCPSLCNVSKFTGLWLSSSKDKICNILACLVKTEMKRMVPWTNLKNKSCWVDQVESIKVVTLTCLCLHLCAYQDQEENDDHLHVTFIIRAWWHHVMKGRWLTMVPSFLTSWVVHEHLVSYVALLSHSSDPLLLSLFIL
jgi:hypothetical protein